MNSNPPAYNDDHQSHIKIEIAGGQVKILHHSAEQFQNGLEKRGWHVKGGQSVRHAAKKPRA